jgi:hypothetical protein
MYLTKEAVDMQRLIIKHCRTNQMIADGFTKPLEGADFKQFLQALDIFDLSESQPGSVAQ